MDYGENEIVFNMRNYIYILFIFFGVNYVKAFDKNNQIDEKIKKIFEVSKFIVWNNNVLIRYVHLNQEDQYFVWNIKERKLKLAKEGGALWISDIYNNGEKISRMRISTVEKNEVVISISTMGDYEINLLKSTISKIPRVE